MKLFHSWIFMQSFIFHATFHLLYMNYCTTSIGYKYLKTLSVITSSLRGSADNKFKVPLFICHELFYPGRIHSITLGT